MIFLTSCGKTKYIYKTEIKEIEIVKLIPVDPKLTDPLLIPTWSEERKPKYIDLKTLYVETKQMLKFANQKLYEIRKSQSQSQSQ